MGWGIGQNSTFSEYGHVAYQIKGNDACSNMVTNILPIVSRHIGIMSPLAGAALSALSHFWFQIDTF